MRRGDMQKVSKLTGVGVAVVMGGWQASYAMVETDLAPTRSGRLRELSPWVLKFSKVGDLRHTEMQLIPATLAP